MKYRTKLFLGYLIVALLLSLALGIVVYKISLNYETEQQENSLVVSSEQLVLQMEDRLNRMDAIIYYILSDQDMLDSIATLGMVTEKYIPSSYILNAKKTLYTGINSDYIYNNSYRTVFYNQCNYAISSYNIDDGNTMAPDFVINQIKHNEKADLAKGKTVMIGAHDDVFGRENSVPVYSVMKAVQGFQMGYIEIENTIDSLKSLDIADAGFPVDIVEKNVTVGGKMAMLDKTFPTLDCASCIVTPKMTEVSQNPNIRILSYSEVVGVKGYIGNFSIDIKRHARYVDETKCTGCGECIEKCPNKKVPNDFNLNLNNKKAIYIPFAQAVPKVATIDSTYCLHMKGLANGKDNVCGFCQKTCGAGAIDFTQKDEVITEKYGAIIVATGYNPIDLKKFDEYAYSQSPDVVSSLEFERLCNASGPTNGHLLRPSDGKEPKTIVFVQCVGSRCSADSEKGHEYCSKVCCMYTAKHAILTRDHYPDTDCYVFYIDVRTPGKNFDEFYRRAVEQYGVHYIKGQVGKVTPLSDGTLDVQGSDLILNRQVHIKADMVVLAASIEADKSARPLATMLTTSMDNNDFFLEAHAKLRPVESPTAGIFLAGCCQGPKDIPETVAQSSGAAAKAI